MGTLKSVLCSFTCSRIDGLGTHPCRLLAAMWTCLHLRTLAGCQGPDQQEFTELLLVFPCSGAACTASTLQTIEMMRRANGGIMTGGWEPSMQLSNLQLARQSRSSDGKIGRDCSGHSRLCARERFQIDRA